MARAFLARSSTLLLLLLLLLLMFAVPASAQDAAEAQSRATRSEACLRPLVAQLERTLSLMASMRTQLRSADAAARADAARAVVSLEQRIHTLGTSIAACVPESASLAPREQVQELSPAAERVGEANPATEVVERDRRLARYVRVEVGERVDGMGSAPVDAVRAAVHHAGARFGRCYERFLERGSLQPMRAIVSFTVRRGNGGGVRRVVVEGGPGGSFNDCLRWATSSIRVIPGASGGEARYAYTLQFGRDT